MTREEAGEPFDMRLSEKCENGDVNIRVRRGVKARLLTRINKIPKIHFFCTYMRDSMCCASRGKEAIVIQGALL